MCHLLFPLLLFCLPANQPWTSGNGDEAPAGPRAGKYKIFSYGATNKPPLYLGYFILDKDGTYSAYLPNDKSTGKGEYHFDSSKSEVIWKSGPYQKEWDGKFTSERDGKTHKIRLKRTTIATNNTD